MRIFNQCQVPISDRSIRFIFQARINSTGRDRVIASIEPPQTHAAKNRLVNLHSNLAVCAWASV